MTPPSLLAALFALLFASLAAAEVFVPSLALPPIAPPYRCNLAVSNGNLTCSGGTSAPERAKCALGVKREDFSSTTLLLAQNKCCKFCETAMLSVVGFAKYAMQFVPDTAASTPPVLTAVGSGTCFCPTANVALVEAVTVPVDGVNWFYAYDVVELPTAAPTVPPTPYPTSHGGCTKIEKHGFYNWTCIEGYEACEKGMIKVNTAGIIVSCVLSVAANFCCDACHKVIDSPTKWSMQLKQIASLSSCSVNCFCASETAGLQLKVIPTETNWWAFGVNAPGTPPSPAPTPIPLNKVCTGPNGNRPGVNRSCYEAAIKSGMCVEFSVTLTGDSLEAVDCCAQCSALSTSTMNFVSYSAITRVASHNNSKHVETTMECICQQATLLGNLSDPTKLIKAFRVEKILDKGVSITSGGSSLDECIVANRPSLMDEHWICYPDSCMASNLSAVSHYKNTSTEHCAAEDICSTPLDSLSARDAIVWGKLCGRTIDACVRDGDEPLELLVKDCTYRASVLCDAGHNAQLDDESIRCRGFALTPHVKPETTAITPYFFTWPMGEGRPSNGLLPPSNAGAQGDSSPQAGWTMWLQTDGVKPPTPPPTPPANQNAGVGRANVELAIGTLAVVIGGILCCGLVAGFVVFSTRREWQKKGQRGSSSGRGRGGSKPRSRPLSWRWKVWGDGASTEQKEKDARDAASHAARDLNERLLAPLIDEEHDALWQVRESRLTPETLAVLRSPAPRSSSESASAGNSPASASATSLSGSGVESNVSPIGHGSPSTSTRSVSPTSSSEGLAGTPLGRGTSAVSRSTTIDADVVEAAEDAAMRGAIRDGAQGHRLVESGLWIAPRRIIVGRKIASGGFGAVRLGRMEADDGQASGREMSVDGGRRKSRGDVVMAQPKQVRTTVVLKAIFAQMIEESDDDEFWHESIMLSEIDHPHVIGFHGVTKKPVGGHLRSETSMQMLMVMEYAANGSLSDALANKTYDRNNFIEHAHTIASTVAWLHERGIIHRDLKPSNVLVAADGALKLCDLGLARFQPGTGPNAASGGGYDTATMTVGTGSAWYMPPEVFRDEAPGASRYDGRKWDVYSLAILFIQLWTVRQNPFPAAWNNMRIAIEVAQGVRPSLKTAPPRLSELLASMWSHERLARPSVPTCVEILEDPALRAELEEAIAEDDVTGVE